MKPDITSRADIEKFINSFYEKVKTDPDIGIIFTTIVPIQWDHHIPIIADFWESILLDNPVYHNNAMQVHYALNNKYPLEKKHFDSWLNIFHSTIDEWFSGPIAELAKKRADSVASLMQYKIIKKTL